MNIIRTRSSAGKLIATSLAVLTSLCALTQAEANTTQPNNNTCSRIVCETKYYYSHMNVAASYKNKSQSNASVNLLLPLTQSYHNLTFIDARSLIQQKNIYEQSLGLGYRHLSHQNFIVGLYGFFDHQFRINGHDFNQMTIGSEFRTKHLYLGTNGYIPLSGQTYHQRSSDIYNPKLVAMAGADAQVGWMWPKRSGLETYLGAYYYTADNVATVIGPRATVTLDLIPVFNRPSTIFNKIELKSTVQYDKPHGTGWMVGINLNFQLSKHHQNNLSTLAMHMTDPIQTQFIQTDYQIKPQPIAKVVAPPNEPSQIPTDNPAITPDHQPVEPPATGETPDPDQIHIVPFGKKPGHNKIHVVPLEETPNLNQPQVISF